MRPRRIDAINDFECDDNNPKRIYEILFDLGLYTKIYFCHFLHLVKMTEDIQELLAKVGAAIKEARKQKGLTLLDLEVRTGISEGDISKIENGKKNFNIATLVKLANGIEISVSTLFH